MTTRMLTLGIEHGGSVHFHFDVRLPVIRDTINALQATVEEFGSLEGAAEDLYYHVAVVASCLKMLGNIPKEAITADLLLDGLSDVDFDIIDDAIRDIKKKRMQSRSPLESTAPPSSCSDNTASVSNASSQ